MAERVDVCIVGSGFGGSISAYRLAELYQAAGQAPSVLVLERGRRHQHTDFRQSMDLDLPSRRLRARPGPGRADPDRRRRRRRLEPLPRRVAALPERDLRAPRPPSRRRPRPPHLAGRDQPRDAQPVLRARRGGAARPAPDVEAGREVRRAVGQDAGQRRPHMRPRAAGDRPEQLHPGQVVPHGLHLRREELGHHELPGRRRAARRAGPAELAGGADRPQPGDALPLPADRLGDRQRRRRPDPPADAATSSRSSARC